MLPYVVLGVVVFIIALTAMQHFMVNNFTNKIKELQKKHADMYLDLITLEYQVKKIPLKLAHSTVRKSAKEVKFYKPKLMKGKIKLSIKNKTETFDAAFFPTKID